MLIHEFHPTWLTSKSRWKSTKNLPNKVRIIIKLTFDNHRAKTKYDAMLVSVLYQVFLLVPERQRVWLICARYSTTNSFFCSWQHFLTCVAFCHLKRRNPQKNKNQFPPPIVDSIKLQNFVTAKHWLKWMCASSDRADWFTSWRSL